MLSDHRGAPGSRMLRPKRRTSRDPSGALLEARRRRQKNPTPRRRLSRPPRTFAHMSENSSSLVCWSVSASTSQIRPWTSSDSSKTGLKFALALSPKRAGPDAATTAPDASTSNVAILASMPRSRSAAYLRRVRARVSRVERDDRPRPDAPRASAGDRSASPPETEHFGRRRAVRDVDVRLRRSGGLAERVLGARVQQRLRELGRPRDEVPERERALACAALGRFEGRPRRRGNNASREGAAPSLASARRPSKWNV